MLTADCNPSMTTDGRITELHLWAVREGLRRAPAAILFEEFCNRLVAAGVPLWRAFVECRTCNGRLYLHMVAREWDREAGEIRRRDRSAQNMQASLFGPSARGGAELRGSALAACVPADLGSETLLDFTALEELAVAGGTDYFAELIPVGMVTEAFPDSGIGYSFATDHPEGFGDDDLRLIQAVLPPVSLAIVSDAEHTISAGLLAAYLGSDAGRRVHAGVVERGSVESIRAVLWYADIRGFTPIADATPGPVLVDMLDDIFEILAAALRPRGGEVLKFLGDGMLASFTFVDVTRRQTGGRRSMPPPKQCATSTDLTPPARIGSKPPGSISRCTSARCLYGNVGAVDRLDFTVIGPAVNEVARIETLCESLARRVLVSCRTRRRDSQRELGSSRCGAHLLRGVREPKKFSALRL